MSKIQYIVLFVFTATLSGYTSGSAEAGSPIVSDYFTEPIPCVSSWYDPIKRATGPRPLEPDTAVVLASNPGDTKLALDVQKKTNRGPCFGTFRETERLYDGYVVHLKSDAVQRQCQNYANHAFLISYSWHPDTKFLLRLYDGPVYKGELSIDLKKVGKKTTIPVSEKENLKKIYDEIEKKMAALHRTKKMDDFRNHPEYERAKPLYVACMKYKMRGEDHKFFSKESFCLCIAQKFTYGGQLPDEELSVYAQDFEKLLKTKEEKSDVFYPHSINDCESCRYTNENRDLKDICTGPGIDVGQYSRYQDSPGQIANKENYTRILNALLNDDYRSIQKDLLFKDFFVAYIQAYSDWCGKKHIKNGVHRKTVKWTEDSITGFQVGLKETYEIYIEDRYVSLFDQYSDDVNHYYKMKYLSGDAILNLTKTIEVMKKNVMDIIGARLVLNDHLNLGCGSQEVQKVYRGLLKFASGSKLNKSKPSANAIRTSKHFNEPESMASSFDKTVTTAADDAKNLPGENIPLPSKLKNPDGFYHVSSRGVTEFRVIQSENNGSYQINWYIVTNEDPLLRPGQLAQGGHWYPAYQQFYSVPYLFFEKGHRCNGWKKDWASWSSIIVPEVFITQNGQAFPGYRYSLKSPPERPHGMRSCLRAQTRGFNCEIKCLNWEFYDQVTKFYLIKGKDQALRLYHYLNSPGSRVITRAEAMAAAAEAKAFEEEEARKKAAREKELKAVISLMSKGEDTVRFPSELPISPQLHDILLARYYPDKLTQEMLEAMMSSRWTYEKSEDNPLGGRFFQKNGRIPTYKELQLLVRYFKPWLLTRARALPETLFLDIPLVYGDPVMKIGTNCMTFLKEDGSEAGIDPYKIQQIEQIIRDCEKQNSRSKRGVNQCRQMKDDLVMAKKQLALAREKGCRKLADSDQQNDRPCSISPDLTLSNFKEQMMVCINNTCGTPTASTDINAYQACAQDVSNQFKNRLAQMMGKPPEKNQQSQPLADDTCEAAEQRVRQIQQRIDLSRCDILIKDSGTVDCAALAIADSPDFLEIGRINLEQMLSCTGGFSIFHHGVRESTELLPKQKPYIGTQFFFMLYPDKLALPYDMPEAVGKGGVGTVNARIKMRITDTDARSFRRYQLGLKVSIKGIDYTDPMRL